MRIKFILILIGLMTAFYCQSQDEHEAAAMITAPNKKQSSNDISVKEKRAALIKAFNKVYQSEGRPSIAVFWNREFDDQLSQWYQETRASQTGESSVVVDDKFEPQDSQEPSYERNTRGGGKIISAQFEEKRIEEQAREGLSEVDTFDFSAGYTSTFLNAPAKIIDRDAIMRLVQRDIAQEAGAEMISDYQKIEADALIGYADYLAEILLIPDSKADVGWTFMVTVKSVSDGQVVAMFRSDGDTPVDTGGATKWVATSSGYEKQQPPVTVNSIHDVGSQIAFETMQSLVTIWNR